VAPPKHLTDGGFDDGSFSASISKKGFTKFFQIKAKIVFSDNGIGYMDLIHVLSQSFHIGLAVKLLSRCMEYVH